MTFILASDLVKKQVDLNNDTMESYSMYSVDYLGTVTWQWDSDRQKTIDRVNYVGWCLPGYHERLRKGELLPHTPMWRFSSKGETSGWYNVVASSSGAYWYATGNYSLYTDWVVTSDQLRVHVPEPYDQYVQEAAAKIYGSGHDTLTFLAEIVSLRGLFENVIKKLVKLEFPRSLQALSNDWLESRYGWRTLIYDIDQLNQAIVNFLMEKRTRYSERSGTSFSTTILDTYSTESTRYWLDFVKSDEVTVSVRGSVVADVEVPQFQFNPIQTGWELIPFSFVLDWIIGVGRALAAASFLALNPTYAASASVMVKLVRSFEVSVGEKKSTYYGGGQGQSATCEAELKIRTPCAVPLTPQFSVRLNALKILDLLGMLVQRIRR